MHCLFLFLSILTFVADWVFGKKFPKTIFLSYSATVLAFHGVILSFFSKDEMISFSGMYFLEFILSIDHVAIFFLILSSFKFSKEKQDNALKLGIVIAIITRVAVILLGSKFIHLPFVIEAFGVLLFFSAFDMLKGKEKGSSGIVHSIIEKVSVLFKRFKNKNFISAVIVIGIVDIIFAIDSIPVAISFSKNINFIMWANILTLLGLNSIFRIVSEVISKFEYMKYAIASMLFFVSLKLMLEKIVLFPAILSVIFMILSISIALIFQIRSKKNKSLST